MAAEAIILEPTELELLFVGAPFMTASFLGGAGSGSWLGELARGAGAGRWRGVLARGSGSKGVAWGAGSGR